MKKKVALFGLCGLFALGIAVATPFCVIEQSQNNIVAVYATDGEEESETTETEQPPVVVEEEQVDEVKEWFDKFFSADKVAMYVSWLAYIGTIIGLAVKIKSLHKLNNLTLKNVSDEVKEVLEKTISASVAEKFDAMLPSVLATQEKTNKIMSIFAKILALSQENTPESRVAILNLIEELGVVSKEVIDVAKEVIDNGVKLAEQAKEDLGKKIDEIVESYDGTSI